MARINLKEERSPRSIKQYLGNILLFCEGKTEKIYFNLFKSSIEKSSKYNNLVIKIANAEGNAQRVLNYGNDFFNKEENRMRYKNFDRYLVYDCDAPSNIQEVIKDSLESINNYKLLVSNPNFEIWLLMHYENINNKLSKYEIEKKLKERLNIEKYNKASEGYTRKIVGDGSRVKLAIENARKLDQEYQLEKLEIPNDITMMDPYTTVYRLMERII